MSYWLMKNEPDDYSIDDLKRDKREMWDGIRNYQVRNMIRDEMKAGDTAIFYHSNAGKETGAAGVMELVGKVYPDPTQFDSKEKYYDPKSDPDNPRWLCIDVKYKEKFSKTVLLSQMREEKSLQSMRIMQRGNRLSVTPITKKEFDKIKVLSNK